MGLGIPTLTPAQPRQLIGKYASPMESPELVAMESMSRVLRLLIGSRMRLFEGVGECLKGCIPEIATTL